MTEPPRVPVLPPGPRERWARSPWPGAALVFLAALASFGWDLASGPCFADESAYYSQSYFAGVFASGRFHDVLWLTFPAYDLPPLPKYLIGAALFVGGYPTPGPADAEAWYRDTSCRFDPPGGLAAARLPSALVGALGCVAVYGLGWLAGGRGVGLLAGLLLAANPLYRLQARRAMSDTPCEAFMMLGLALGLWSWKQTLSARPRPSAVLAGAVAGLGAGLALLSKLSGLLALMVLAAWALLAIVTGERAGRKFGFPLVVAVATVIAALTFLAMNPYLTAHPDPRFLPPRLREVAGMSLGERVRKLFRLRFEVSADQKQRFKRDALHTPTEKLAVSVVQGFGRFGLFGPSYSDSTRRFDLRQDWGVVVWLPWVAAGAVWAAARGRAQWSSGVPATAWAVLAHFGVAFTVVTLYLPMAWDRYLLPVQAPACLLASGAAVAGATRLTGRWAWARRPGGDRP